MSEPGPSDDDLASLVRALDRLEERGYVALDDLHAAGIPRDVSSAAVDAAIVLVDYRRRLVDGRVEPVTLCRLNRRHEVVRRLLG